MENDPLVGKQLGAYLIQSKLGEGGMARVYKAYHARLRRDVAIKVILPQVADKAGFRERFEREAQLVASLEHRNIVGVYDFGEAGNLTYLVMQYVGGGTLRDQLRNQGYIEPRQTAQYMIQMARALHHAHVRGIVHRDVKPQNMLVSISNPNELLLSDFGIAKLFDSSREETLSYIPGSMGSDPSLTNVDQMLGTAEYMAPEQINRQPVDARTDVYALGIVLFQMLTGQIPFSSTTVQGLLFQHVYTPPRSVREVNPNVPEVFELIIARALAKAPEQRYQSAEAMAQALEAILTPSTDQLPYSPYYRPRPISHETPNEQPGSVSTDRTTTADGGRLVAPPQRRSTSKSRVIRIVSMLLVGLVVIGVILSAGWIHPPTPPPSPSFTEHFQDNSRSWTVGNLGGLTASVGNTYTLAVGDGNTYFPNPAAVGPLPNTFTLAAQMEQSTGALNVFYGLAFRLRQDGNKVYSYAFVIDGNHDYEVLKYNADVSPVLSPLWQGSSTAIHTGLNQNNMLEASVQGSSFSFKINGTAVPVGQNSSTTIRDSAYSGGNLGLLVAGPNTGFTVTSVMLAAS